MVLDLNILGPPMDIGFGLIAMQLQLSDVFPCWFPTIIIFKSDKLQQPATLFLFWHNWAPCTLLPFRTPKYLTAPYFSWKVCWTHETIPGQEVDLLYSGSPVQLESQYSANLEPSPRLMPILRYLAQILETSDQSPIFVHSPHFSNPSLHQFHVGLHHHFSPLWSKWQIFLSLWYTSNHRWKCNRSRSIIFGTQFPLELTKIFFHGADEG